MALVGLQMQPDSRLPRPLPGISVPAQATIGDAAKGAGGRPTSKAFELLAPKLKKIKK
jgi:hypothetical protein